MKSQLLKKRILDLDILIKAYYEVYARKGNGLSKELINGESNKMVLTTLKEISRME